MADRTCDRCGTRMSPYLPRKKSDNGEYLCRGCQQIEGYAARKLLEWSRMGSTGQDCRFIEEQPGEWYYELEDWGGEYTQYGPFKSLEEGERHLRDNHANPGGWSVHYYDEKLGSRKVAHDSGD